MEINKFIELAGIQIPMKFWDKIVVLSEERLLYYYSEPLQATGFSDFYLIPGFERYAIRKDGVLINIETMRIKTWGMSKLGKNGKKGGYRSSICVDNFGQRKSLARHRAIALAFIPRNGIERSIVNHIDGVPGNDVVENLEWCTYSENNQHAYDMNLYGEGKKIPILYRNTCNGEIRKFDSVSGAVRILNLADSLIRLRMEKPEIEYDDGHQFKRDDDSEWPAFISKAKAFKVTQVASRNVFTGEVMIHSNLLIAEAKTGVLNKTIHYHCKTNRVVPIAGYNFRSFPYGLNWPIHTDTSLKLFRDNPDGYKSYAVISYTEDGTEVAVYSSLLEAAEIIKIGAPLLRLRILKQKPINGLIYKFYDPTQIETYAPLVSND